jgi:hypothetical protein
VSTTTEFSDGRRPLLVTVPKETAFAIGRCRLSLHQCTDVTWKALSLARIEHAAQRR